MEIKQVIVYFIQEWILLHYFFDGSLIVKHKSTDILFVSMYKIIAFSDNKNYGGGLFHHHCFNFAKIR